MEIGCLKVREVATLSENEIETPTKRSSRTEIELFSKNSIWITYRKNMPPLPFGKTSDSGWGCMIRSLQMVLAQTFVTMVIGNNWKYQPQCLENERVVFHLRTIINLFNDHPSGLLSIHRLVAEASTKGVPEGKWWGPSFASEIASNMLNKTHIFRSCGYVAKVGRIIGPEIEELTQNGDLFNPCVIFVPLRLGPDSPDDEFRLLLKEIFEIPQCMGMLGGKPSYAHYFHTFDGSTLWYLDPHTTKCYVRGIEYKNIDPSVSLIFLVKHREDYDNFMKCFENQNFSRLFSFKNEADLAVDPDEFISLDDDMVLSEE
ncbi:Cysteine protease [Entamoeba marina]